MSWTDNYKRYDPSREGYGNPHQWREEFYTRISPEEVEEILADSDPYKILGVTPRATLIEIKNAFRKLMMKWHPDKNPDNIEKATEMSKKIIAAYQFLTDK